jgi:hypothetical protein
MDDRLLSIGYQQVTVRMSTTPVATRLPEDVADHVEAVADSPATEHQTRSEVVREIVISSFDS